MRRLVGMTSSVWFPYFSSSASPDISYCSISLSYLSHFLPSPGHFFSFSVSEVYGSIKEGLRRSFAEKANEFSLLLDTISLSITKFEGVLEVPPPHPFLLSPKESIDIDPRINLNRSARLKRVWRLSKLSWVI